MTKIEYGFRPSVLWKKGNRNKRNMSGAGSIVAIIGAFPCVSPEILHFTDLETARNALNIEHGVHDKEYVLDSNGELIKNPKYFYGAGALSQVFLDKTDLQGASEVVICNITTRKYNANGDPECEADGTTPKFNTTLVHEKNSSNPKHALYQKINYDKLRVAFSKLKKERFNNLVFAYPLDEIKGNDETIQEPQSEFDECDNTVSKFLKRYRLWTTETYKVQHPIIGFFGLTTNPVLSFQEQNGSNISTQTIDPSVIDSMVDTNYSMLINTEELNNYLDIFKDERYYIHSLGALFAEGTYDANAGYILNPVESVAQYAGILAGSSVDQSFTQRVVPTVGGIGLMKQQTSSSSTISDVPFEPIYEELNYDPDLTLNPDGYKVLSHGATMFECTNRNTNEYSVVASTLPCGFDIAHVRTSAYIIEQIVLNPFLGQINNDTTLQAIDSVITSIKNSMVERFPIVESIAHTVEKISPTCVRIRVHVNFYGIILNEVIYMSISVENQDRMIGKGVI